MKKIFCIISCVFITCLGFCQQRINGKADKSEYMLGDWITYSFSIDLPKDNVVVSTDYNFSDTLQLLTQSQDTAKGKINYHLTFGAYVDGDIALPKYTIYKNNGAVALYEVNAPIIKVKSPVIDTVNIEVKPLKDIIKVPITFKEILPFVVIAILVALMVVGIILLIKFFEKKPKAEKQVIIEQIPEDIEALRALDNLSAEHYFEKEQGKQHYITLTDIMWKYIFRRYGINAFEMTSSEIISSLHNVCLPEEEINRMRYVFQVADLVKFAKHQSSIQENLDTMQECKTFVNNTKRVEIKKEEPQNKEEEI